MSRRGRYRATATMGVGKETIYPPAALGPGLGRAVSVTGSAPGAVSPALRERVLSKRRSPPAEGAGLRAFSEVSDALSGGGEFLEILHLIARQARALVGAGRCNLYLREAESGLFRGQVTEGPDLDDRVRRLACGSVADRFTAEILAHGAPVVIDNAQNDPRPIRATMRSWKCGPSSACR